MTCGARFVKLSTGERVTCLLPTGHACAHHWELRCHDCERPAVHGVRCAEHRERHRAANLKASRARRGDPQNMRVTTSRRCGLCGEKGHDRRLCPGRPS